MGLAIITAKASINSFHQRIGVVDLSFEKCSCHSDSASGISGLKSQLLPDGTNPMGPAKDQFPAESATKTVVDLLFILL
jgi:hypothetical protein